jgi:hypothetical protein
MGTRGRKSEKSANLLVIDVQRQRLKPPPELNEREADIFRSIVDSCDPAHFRKAELPVLTSYCTAVNLSRWHAHCVNAGEVEHHRPWLETTKLVALLASRLRLAPSTRLDKNTVARHAQSHSDYPPPWERRS